MVDIAVIVEGLAARIDELCRQLLPAGRALAGEWCVGSVGGEAGQSCRIRLSGAKRGVWADFSTGEAGDALDLVAAVIAHGDKRQALRWAKDWLGLAGDDARALARTRRAAQEAREAPKADADGEQRRRWAMQIWLGAVPTLKGTAAGRYLAGRGIDLEGTLGRQPRALRFHPRLWHRASGRHWPALVAAVVDGSGRFTAVHRIWLEERRCGSVTKAPVQDPKMTLGGIEGGSIRLWRGSSGKALKAAPAGSSAWLSEGIEDGLVNAMARPAERYLATVSLANMGTVDLPEAITDVVLCLDNDEGNARAGAAVERAIALHRAAGRAVRLARPPAGVKDSNELLLARTGPAPARCEGAA